MKRLEHTPRYSALIDLLNRGPAYQEQLLSHVYGVTEQSSDRLRRCAKGAAERLIGRARKRLAAEGMTIRWKPSHRQYVLVIIPDWKQ